MIKRWKDRSNLEKEIILFIIIFTIITLLYFIILPAHA